MGIGASKINVENKNRVLRSHAGKINAVGFYSFYYKFKQQTFQWSGHNDFNSLGGTTELRPVHMNHWKVLICM